MTRNYTIYLALILIAITLGMFTRSSFMPARDSFITIYAGDTIWAIMVYLIFCVIFPKWSSLKIAIYALAFCFAIEFSQICQVDWLNNIRQNRFARLVLGVGYQSSDLICYSVGIIISYALEIFICNKQARSA